MSKSMEFQVGKSDAERMVLLDVTLRASGLYMCEVSTEAPSFASVHGQAWMSPIGELSIRNKELLGYYETSNFV